MKDSILKKIISLLLSVTLAVGMNGVPVWAEDSASPENGIAGHAEGDLFTVEMYGKTWHYQEAKQFEEAWKMVKGETAVIHLWDKLDIGKMNFGNEGTDSIDTLIVERGQITLKMEENAKLCNDHSENAGAELISVRGSGTFILSGGSISSIGSALSVSGGNVRIENTLLEGKGNGATINYAGDGKNFQMGECTIKGKQRMYIQETDGVNLSVSDMLASGYAFQKKDGEWIKNVSDLNASDSDEESSYQVVTYPATLTQQLIGAIEIIYGETGTHTLQVSATTDKVSDTFAYQWQKKEEEGDSWEDVEGATSGTFIPPNTLSVGKHYYRCQAKLGDRFYLNSEEVSITVMPKEVSAKITGGKISKKYDGNKEVLSNSLDLLSIELDGVLASESISGSAMRGTYESEKPGKHKVTVVIGLDENNDGYKNYKLSGNPYELEGEITGVLLSDDTLEAGTEKKLEYYIWPQPKDSSNSNVSWESSNPAVATVDENGRVTAVGAGNAVITVTVTTADGLMKATCNVTVSGAGNSGSASGGSTSGGSSGSPSTNVRLPFLTDRPYKRGWSIIQAEAEKAAAEPGNGPAYIGIDMNGTVLVPGRIFTAVKNKDVTLAFDMGGGISWSVCGKDITAETVSDTNLSVKAGGGVIPLDVLNRTAGDCAHLELSPAHNGPFGFTAALTLQTGKNENGIAIGAGDRAAFAGMYANLYVYNTSLRSLEFVCAEQVGEDGIVHLPVDRASDFTVILSADPMGGTDTPEDPSGGQNEIEPEPENLPVGSVKLSKTLYTYSGKAKKPAVTAVDTAGMQIPDKYYTVSYQNNIKVGKAAAVIVFKDGYSGTVEKAFTIRPAGTSIKKAAAVSGGFTLKWTKRTAQTSGYQIQYTRNSGFKGSSTKRVNVKKVSVTKKTIKKLKTGKKYYVRIRTYKKVKIDGTNKRVYSAWSRAAALRVK